MPGFKPAVIPFPKRHEPRDWSRSAVCHFQAAAELRVAMLHRLFDILARTPAPTCNDQPLHECCDSARALLHDVVVLYRRSLAQASSQGRGGNE